MEHTLWKTCLEHLERELSERQLNTWIHPLQAIEEGDRLRLLAPNRFVLDLVRKHYLSHIHQALGQVRPERTVAVELEIGSNAPSGPKPPRSSPPNQRTPSHPGPRAAASHPPAFKSPAPRASTPKSFGGGAPAPKSSALGPFQVLGDEPQEAASRPAKRPEAVSNGTPQPQGKVLEPHRNHLNPEFTFASFVEGKSNQLALAACQQVARNPGRAYNPLFIYGGTGLGKTHLMHAVGNLLQGRQGAQVVYQHSEHFVADLVGALRHNVIGDFKRHYRSLDALLIDDIQFLSGKERSQEEFFHTFNTLLEGRQQIILTCDRFPKEVTGLEERLKSRFGSGLTVAIEPPELETRVAILKAKARHYGLELGDEVGFFIAKRVRSNVRELEGALRRVQANAQFTGQAITMAFAQDALRDLISLQDKSVTIDTIKQVVADFYHLELADLSSTTRLRAVTRPRQLAMALAKELTDYSLPEIGDAFGGRDHTTVLHACRKVQTLRKSDREVRDDFIHLLNLLSG